MVKEEKDGEIPEDDEDAVIIDVDGDQDSESLEPTPSTSQMSGRVQIRPLKSAPLRRRALPSIAVPEKDGNGLRIYRYSSRSPDGVMVCYKCPNCESLWRNTHDTLPDGEQKPFEGRCLTVIKTVEGQIVGNAYPQHHPDCLPVSEKSKGRREVVSSVVKTNDFELSQHGLDHWQSSEKDKNGASRDAAFEDIPFPDWKSVSRRYREIERKRLRLENEETWPSEEQSEDRSEDANKRFRHSGLTSEASSSSTPIYSARSKRLTMSSIVVPEDDSQLVRVYRFNNKSRNGRTMYYRCSKCDTLCNNDKKAGLVRAADFRASVKTVNGKIVGNAHPKHHPECTPISTQALKAQEIDKTCRVRVKEGILSPKQAWDMGQQMALEHSTNDDQAADVVPFPDWKRLRRKYSELGRSRKRFLDQSEEIVYGDDINIGSVESVPMQSTMPDVFAKECSSCNCRQYYEANVEIHENIVNCLDEMRAIRDEMRQMFDEARNFVVEEPIYQIIEEP